MQRSMQRSLAIGVLLLVSLPRCRSTGGWSYADGLPECDAAELSLSTAEDAWLERAVSVFQRCGIVALHGVDGNGHVRAFRDGVEDALAPLLASRDRVRAALLSAMVGRKNLRELWQGPIREEPLFAAGDVYKERNDGRIDLSLPFAAPFNETSFVANADVLLLLRRLLGSTAELKSMHAIYSLAVEGDASPDAGLQHWHRDTQLLFQRFGSEDPFHLPRVHDAAEGAAEAGGVHLPPYAINVFVPLVDMTEANGPTEFTLGSHVWGADVIAEEERRGDAVVDHRFLVPAGTAIVADYRTLHRGTQNRSGAPRPMAMFVWGRDWWTDSVNYGMHDYGGFRTKLDVREELGETEEQAAALRLLREEEGDWRRRGMERMFWGLVNQWEQGLFDELRRRQRQGRRPDL